MNLSIKFHFIQFQQIFIKMHLPFVTQCNWCLFCLIKTIMSFLWLNKLYYKVSKQNYSFFCFCFLNILFLRERELVHGAQVRRHHTLTTLSQLPAAIRVFSQLTAMSEISAECPRSVARRRPSSVAQIFTKQSSEPCSNTKGQKISNEAKICTTTPSPWGCLNQTNSIN